MEGGESKIYSDLFWEHWLAALVPLRGSGHVSETNSPRSCSKTMALKTGKESKCNGRTCFHIGPNPKVHVCTWKHHTSINSSIPPPHRKEKGRRKGVRPFAGTHCIRERMMQTCQSSMWFQVNSFDTCCSPNKEDTCKNSKERHGLSTCHKSAHSWASV